MDTLWGSIFSEQSQHSFKIPSLPVGDPWFTKRGTFCRSPYQWAELAKVCLRMRLLHISTCPFLFIGVIYFHPSSQKMTKPSQSALPNKEQDKRSGCVLDAVHMFYAVSRPWSCLAFHQNLIPHISRSKNMILCSHLLIPNSTKTCRVDSCKFTCDLA